MSNPNTYFYALQLSYVKLNYEILETPSKFLSTLAKDFFCQN